MSNPKVDLSKLSLNQLEQLTGSSFRTIKKLLKDIPPVETTGNAILYEAREALFMIFEAQGARTGLASGGSEDLLNPAQEKAKLDKLKAELIDLQVQEKKGILIPASDVEKMWSDMVLATKAKLRSIPNRLAAQLAAITEPKTIEKKLTETIEEALNELSVEKSDADSE